MREVRRSVVIFAGFLILCTGCYPLVVWGIGQFAFTRKASGSLMYSSGRVVGSRLIGQRFTAAGYFQGRPSSSHYDELKSGGSNLGPTNNELLKEIRARIRKQQRLNQTHSAVPIDLVTGSGSGLDPDISPAAALYQVKRVARARGLPIAAVRRLVKSHIVGPTFGLLGAPRVNVLVLNIALNRLSIVCRRLQNPVEKVTSGTVIQPKKQELDTSEASCTSEVK